MGHDVVLHPVLPVSYFLSNLSSRGTVCIGCARDCVPPTAKRNTFRPRTQDPYSYARTHAM